MQEMTYYLEANPQPWSGLRQMHVAGCGLMPEDDQVKPIGTFTKAMTAMMQARKIHRRAASCPCCKAH